MRNASLIIGLAALGIAAVAGSVAVNHRYSSASATQPTTLPQAPAVYLIGDSWFAAGAFDAPIQQSLNARGWHLPVKSYGFPGERSRLIFERFQALPVGPGFCVLSVGANDAISHFGAAYYAHHLRLLIRAAQQRGCIPVVLSLPHVNQSAAASRLPFYLRLRDALYQSVFDSGAADTIKQYRAAAGDARSVNPDRFIGTPSSRPELWADFVHLNAKGRSALGSEIAAAVVSAH